MEEWHTKKQHKVDFSRPKEKLGGKKRKMKIPKLFSVGPLYFTRSLKMLPVSAGLCPALVNHSNRIGLLVYSFVQLALLGDSVFSLIERAKW